ncbi:MAG: hypothetical protein LBT77_02330, partial [Mycoplasmataceae bacterium]|nr:hypothetical protein [Mycoplasmataceae bacterium]
FTAWAVYAIAGYTSKMWGAMDGYRTFKDKVIQNYDANEGHILEWMNNEKEDFIKKSHYVDSKIGFDLIEVFTGKTSDDINNMETFINYYSHNS